MKYVVDASVAVKWYLPESYADEAIRLLEGDHDLHVPELILPEFSSIIWKKVRRGQVVESEGKTTVDAFQGLRWTVHSHKETLTSAYTGAISTGQTVYDWTYLALALSLSCEFVTADEKFYKALVSTPFQSNLKWIGEI